MKHDREYLPKHYTLVERPFFQGNGHHTVRDLENICIKFTEYTHQQSIIKEALRNENAELIKGVNKVFGLLK